MSLSIHQLCHCRAVCYAHSILFYDFNALYNNLYINGFLSWTLFTMQQLCYKCISAIFSPYFHTRFYSSRNFYRPSPVSFLPRILPKQHPRQCLYPSPLLSSNWGAVMALPPFDFVYITLGVLSTLPGLFLSARDPHKSIPAVLKPQSLTLKQLGFHCGRATI